jgi:very-short-patch-repair endonuclease
MGRMARGTPDPDFFGGESDRSGQKRPQSAPGAAMARVVGSQDGVVSLLQLFEHGYTYRQVRRLVAKGVLHPKHRGVFAVGHPKLTTKGELRAALMACGDTAFLAGRTALADAGLRPMNLKAIEVTVVAKSTPKHPGLTVHRTSKQPHRSEVQTRRGLRISSVPRALIDRASKEKPEELLRLIEEGVRKGVLNFASMEEALERHARNPGITKLKDVYGRYRPGPDRKSGLERSFDAYAATDPRIPRYDKNVHMGPYEFDCRWPEHRVVLELDGRPYHRALEDRDKDNAKDIWVQTHQMSILRVSDFRWEYDRAGAVDDLLTLLAVGRRRAA